MQVTVSNYCLCANNGELVTDSVIQEGKRNLVTLVRGKFLTAVTVYITGF
jgi:hypothetical protein